MLQQVYSVKACCFIQVRSMGYEQMLKAPYLYTRKNYRKRSDLIQVFKVVKVLAEVREERNTEKKLEGNCERVHIRR